MNGSHYRRLVPSVKATDTIESHVVLGNADGLGNPRCGTEVRRRDSSLLAAGVCRYSGLVPVAGSAVEADGSE